MFYMEKQKVLKNAPKEDLRLGTTLDGKEGMIRAIEETFDVKCIDGVLDLSENEELAKMVWGK